MTIDNSNTDDGWFKLPPTTATGMLPPGDYAATIASARVSRKPEAAWLMLDIAPDAADGDAVSTVVCIAAKPGSRYVSNLARGRRMLAALMAATGARNITDPSDLPKHLNGARVLVSLSHRMDGFVVDYSVNGVKPLPATAAAPEPTTPTNDDHTSTGSPFDAITTSAPKATRKKRGA